MDGATTSWLLAMVLVSADPKGEPGLPEVLAACKFAIEPGPVLSPIEIGRSKRLRFTVESSGEGRDATYETAYHLLDPKSCRMLVLEQAGGGGSPLEHVRILATKGKLSDKERRALLDWAGVRVARKDELLPQLPSLGEAPSTGAELWATKPTKFRWAKTASPLSNLARKLEAKTCKMQSPWNGEDGDTSDAVPGLAATSECYDFFLGTKFEAAGDRDVDGSKLTLYTTKARNSSLLIGLEAKDRFAWVGWVFGVYEPQVLGLHDERIWVKVRNLELGDQLIAIDPTKAVVQRVGLIADGTIDANATGLTVDEAPLFEWTRVVDVLKSAR